MESDLLGLDLAIFDFDFVADENNGDVLANASQVTMPVGNVFVRDTRSDIKHDDSALPLDVVPVAKPTELLLSRGIPYIEFDRTTVGVEKEWVHFNPKRGDIFLFEFTSQVTFHKGSLANATISDENKFEFRSLLIKMT